MRSGVIFVLSGLLILTAPAQARPGHIDDLDFQTYVGNDPANKTDPSGKRSGDCVGQWCDNGLMWSSQDEQKDAITGAKAVPGMLLDVGLDSAPIIGEGRAAINFYNDPSAANGIIVAASLVDLGGAAKVVADIGRLEKGALRLEKNAAEHEARAAQFEANPTVKPEMTGMDPELIAKQQKQRVEDLRKEAAEYRKQAAERRALAAELREKLQ